LLDQGEGWAEENVENSTRRVQGAVAWPSASVVVTGRGVEAN
jgi:hypothetical protein